MTNQPRLFGKVVHWVRQYWIGGLALLLIAFVLFKSVPASAAPATKPVNQTVPNPTATKENTPVPQATNTPKPHKDNDDDNNNDNNNNQQAPTPTAVPEQPTAAVPQQPQQPPSGNGPTGVVIADPRLNVRQGPGTNFAIVGHAVRGDVVSVQQRNAAGDWWQVCCASDTKSAGWVTSKFVQPNFDATQANTLIPVAGDAAASAPATPTTVAPAPTEVITPTATVSVAPTAVVTTSATAVPTDTATTPSTSPSVVTIQQTPALVWQGKEFELSFVITNTGSVQATNVELRDELPPELTFVSAEAGSDGTVAPQASVAGKSVLSVQWPRLAAGAAVTATVTLQMAAKLPDGTVIDNLAVAAADQMESSTAGISLGLPPTSLPDFQ